MLVVSRILYGMIFGLALVLISEVCLADQDNTPFIEEALSVPLDTATLYKMNESLSIVGDYSHYEDPDLSADRVFVGLKTSF